MSSFLPPLGLHTEPGHPYGPGTDGPTGGGSSSSKSSGPSTTDQPLETRELNGQIWQRMPDTNVLRQITGYHWERVATAPSASAAGSHNYQLDAAQAALNGYLQAQSLADARQLSAFQEMEKVAQFALPPGSTAFPGYEEGGPAHQFASMIGAKQYTTPPVTNIPVNPSALAQPAAIPQNILDMISGIIGAGGLGGGGGDAPPAAAATPPKIPGFGL